MEFHHCDLTAVLKFSAAYLKNPFKLKSLVLSGVLSPPSELGIFPRYRIWRQSTFDGLAKAINQLRQLTQLSINFAIDLPYHDAPAILHNSPMLASGALLSGLVNLQWLYLSNVALYDDPLDSIANIWA